MQLNLLTPTCNYPANSVPACSTYIGAIQQGTGTCFFSKLISILERIQQLTPHATPSACDANSYNCGQFCIPLTQNCVSGIPQRRDLGPSAALCPVGMSACYLANSASLAKAKAIAWECMDTQSDIEACGGCQFPQTGEVGGADCTELEGVDTVAVSIFHGLGIHMADLRLQCKEGECQAITCIRGYKLQGTECVSDNNYKSFWVQHA